MKEVYKCWILNSFFPRFLLEYSTNNYYKFDLFAMSETWLNSTWTDPELAIDNYTIYRYDRNDAKGGGVAIYVKKLAYLSTNWSSRQRINRWICMHRDKTTRCWNKISIYCFLPSSQLNVKATGSNYTDDWISFLSLERNYSDRWLQHKSSWCDECKLQAHQDIPGCRPEATNKHCNARRQEYTYFTRSPLYNPRR